MKFVDTWRSESCPVEQWYQAQLKRPQEQKSPNNTENQPESSQEQKPPTHFTTIEHRSTLNAPFFHEFLIIPLFDGSFYRVERIGVGLDVGAVRLLGCEAQDLIEWFPAEQYAVFTHNKYSKLIAEVQFPHEFDILDVLAVCYSIQKHIWTSAYTLQCYNCYFFCCTILSILARRTADWESIIPASRWGDLLDQAFQDMAQLASNPPKPEAGKYLALRVCSLLDPDSSEPAQFLLDRLRTLVLEHEIFRRPLSEALWWSNYSPLVFKQLQPLLVDPKVFRGPILAPGENYLTAVEILCGADNSSQCARALMSAWRNEPGPESSHIGRLIQVIYREEQGVAQIKHLVAAKKELELFLTRKQSSKIIQRVLAPICVPPLALLLGIHMARGFGKESHLPGLTRLRLGAKMFTAGLQMGSTLLLTNPPRNNYDMHLPRGEYLLGLLPDFGNDLLKRLERRGISSPEYVQEACRVMMRDNTVWSSWEHSVLLLLAETLSAVVKAEMLTSKTRFKIVCPNKHGPPSSDEVDIFGFQEHIRTHVRKYADRVGRSKLDSAELVRRDVSEAIMEIWCLMPSGFGMRRQA
ncbi:hypothetical protein FRC08_002253 [Ceratobasidium sp. 394]|nr:hypothetical protein FRC08_002253 [Ceratobasidium sp. 394]